MAVAKSGPKNGTIIFTGGTPNTIQLGLKYVFATDTWPLEINWQYLPIIAILCFCQQHSGESHGHHEYLGTRPDERLGTGPD